MNRKIIFLDFDGVLNTEQYQARLAVDGKPNKDAWGPLFDPHAVENLRKIIEATGAAIVISSTWRYIHRLGSLRMMWEIRELPGEILNTLPCGATYISRGEDIDIWLNQHGQPHSVKHYRPYRNLRNAQPHRLRGSHEADDGNYECLINVISSLDFA